MLGCPGCTDIPPACNLDTAQQTCRWSFGRCHFVADLLLERAIGLTNVLCRRHRGDNHRRRELLNISPLSIPKRHYSDPTFLGRPPTPHRVAIRFRQTHDNLRPLVAPPPPHPPRAFQRLRLLKIRALGLRKRSSCNQPACPSGLPPPPNWNLIGAREL